MTMRSNLLGLWHEWGVRRHGGGIEIANSREDAEIMALIYSGSIVRRRIHYGAWETIPPRENRLAEPHLYAGDGPLCEACGRAPGHRILHPVVPDDDNTPAQDTA